MRYQYRDQQNFSDLCRAVALAGSFRDLQLLTSRSSVDVQAVCRAAVDATSIATAPGFADIVSPFLQSLSQASILDRVLADGAALVMSYSAVRTNIAITGIAGGDVAEGAPKPIRSSAFDATEPLRYKPTSVVVASEEFLSSPNGAQALTSELRRALTSAMNAVFLSALAAGADTQAASGSTAAAIAADLTAAMQALGPSERSRFYLAVSPATCVELALKSGTDGALAFLDLTVSGGSLQGITVMPSDSLTTDAVLFDAARLGIGDGGLQIDQSRHGSIQLDDAPDGTAAPYSLWQRNARGIRAERPFSVAYSSDTSSGIPAVVITNAW